MTPIEIGQIPWLPQVRGEYYEAREKWLKKADYLAIYAIGADTGPLKVGTTADIRQRASQLRTDPRAPRWLKLCYMTPKLLARRILADVTKQLSQVHLGQGWYEVEAEELDILVTGSATRANIRLRTLESFIEGVKAARWNDSMKDIIRMGYVPGLQLMPDEVVT